MSATLLHDGNLDSELFAFYNTIFGHIHLYSNFIMLTI